MANKEVEEIPLEILITNLGAIDVWERSWAAELLLNRVEELLADQSLLAKAIPALSRAIFSETMEARYSVETLITIGPLAEPALPFLIESLRYQCDGIGPGRQKWLTIRAIVAIGERAIPHLAQLVEWNVPGSAGNAIDALYAMGPLAAEARIRLGLATDNPRNKRKFYEGQDAAEPQPPLTLARLKFLIKSSDEEVRIEAAEALRSIAGEPQEKMALFSYLLSDPCPYVKGQALRSLTLDSAPLDFALPAVLGALYDDSSVVRREAVCTIGNSFSDYAEPFMAKLRTMLFEEVNDVKIFVLLTYEKLGPRAAQDAPLIMEIIESHRAQYAARMYACRVIVAMGKAAASVAPRLKQLYQDKEHSKDIRGWINKALKKIDS